MSLLRADKLANQLNNGGPIIVGPSTVSGDLIVTNNITSLSIGVTDNVSIGGSLTVDETLTVDKSGTILGSVGVGTTNTLAKLHVYGEGQTTSDISDSGSFDSFLRLSDDANNGGNGGGIIFSTIQGDVAGSAGFAAIKGLLTNGSNNTIGDLAFSTRLNVSDNTLSESLRILSNGSLLSNVSSKYTVESFNRSHYIAPFMGSSGNQIVISSRSNGYPGIFFTKTSGAEVNSNDAVSKDSVLGSIQAFGSNDTGFVRNNTKIEFRADQDFTDSPDNTPGRIEFWTCPPQSTSSQERVRITSDGYVGIGSTNPSSKFSVNGNTIISGILTAQSFYGDGSNLTGVANTANVSTNTLVVSGVSTLGVVTGAVYYGDGSNLTGVVTSITAGDNISIDSSTGNVTITGLANTANVSTNNLVCSGIATFSSSVSIGGTLTYEDVTNVDSVGIITARKGIEILSGGIDVTGITTLGIVTGATYYGDGSNLTGIGDTTNVRTDTLVVTGVSTLGVVTGVTAIEATTYYGDGSNLTGLTHSQVSGVMADLVDDTTPQLGGNLDLNSNDITGTGNINITGITTLGGDVNIADKIIHIGDTDTSIRFPSNDTFTIETAGSERVRIDSAGNVGIGTDSNLTANLTIGNIENTSVTNKGALAIKTLSNSDSDIGASAIYIEQPDFGYGFYHKVTSYFGATHHQIQESGSGNMLLTISDSGDVGIKTNYADTFALKILAEDENVIKIENFNSGLFGSEIRVFQDSNTPVANDRLLTLDIRGNDSGGNETIYSKVIASIEDPTDGSEDGKLTIQTRTAGTLTDRIVIDSGGVGIGTDAPGYKLDVRGTGTIARFGDPDINNDSLWIDITNSQYPKLYNPSSADTLSIVSTGSVQVSIDSNNNDTTKTFTVVSNGHSGSGTELFKINESGETTITAGSTSALFIKDNSVDSSGLKLYSDSAGLSHINAGYGNLVLETSGTERFRIASDGIATFNSGEVVFGGTAVSATEGGQIRLTSASGQSNGDTIIDMNSANFRIFYSNSPNKGAYLTLSSLADGVGSRILTTSDEGAGNGMDADTVDTLHASSFLRSDISNTLNGNLTISSDSATLNFSETDTTTSARIRVKGGNFLFQAGASGSGATASSGTMYFSGYDNADIGTFQVRDNGSWNNIWHAGNDGAGSGLDADTLDGISSASFLRSDAVEQFDGQVSGRTFRFRCPDGRNAGSSSASLFPLEVYQNSNVTNSDAAMAFHISGRYATYFGLDRETNDLFTGGWSDGTTKHKIWHAGNDGAGSGLDADTLDGISSASFLRSDTGGTVSGAVTFNGNVNIRNALDLADNDILRFGTGDDAEFFCNGSHFFLDLNSGIGNFYIRDGTTTRFTFDDDGSFTATSNITAYSDINLKKNIEVIPNALDKVSQIRGVTFDRIDLEDEPRQSGVIAQEIEKVLPEVVRTTEDGTKTVAYGNMVGLLIEAIKEQQKQIDDLKAKLEEGN